MLLCSRSKTTPTSAKQRRPRRPHTSTALLRRRVACIACGAMHGLRRTQSNGGCMRAAVGRGSLTPCIAPLTPDPSRPYAPVSLPGAAAAAMVGDGLPDWRLAPAAARSS
jgi:hypothetical protein